MSLLVHTCCAPCSTAVVERLQSEDYDVSLYFYNPNIHPEKEYKKRLKELEKWAKKTGVDLVVAPYEKDKWHEAVKGLEKEPEKGSRCDVCYEMRMSHAAQYAKENFYDVFTTVLSISPHKSADKINKIGNKLCKELKIAYLESDFKKDGGFQRSVELSKEYNLFRQDYCGCVYSNK
jgi:predicted adenine nucleotide alpha hydrolase (AANH) superfamily ATPase